MIDKITKNNNEIEYYYNIGSLHGDIRMMLSKYVYDEVCFNEIIAVYGKLFGEVKNLNIDLNSNRIVFDIKGSSLKFQENFAHCMYCVIKGKLNTLHDCINLFEKQNPKYKIISESIDILMNSNYYITLFRPSFIKHENSTSCIVQL